MTSSICSSASAGLEGRLKDTRDQKVYWVGKLKDNNCWMTQNLDLDLTNITLTSADSDVLNDWAPKLTSVIWNDTTTSPIRYFNPGEYVYTTPTLANSCGTSGITSLASCADKGWQSVNGWTASDDSTFAIIADVVNRTYNAHFLAGNYYTYAAAVANTAPSNSGTATGSICPKGWQLPISSSATSKSFGFLLTQYGVQSNIMNTTDGYDIRIAPLYFVYGGFVAGSSLNYAGSEGIYWTSTATGSSNAYALRFTLSVTPSVSFVGYPRYHGLSVRCVAR